MEAREAKRDRERENPRPFTDLLAVAAVSYLGLRGAPLYRRTATLGSPPHLLYSAFPILSFRLSRSPSRRRVFLPPGRASRVRLSGFLSGTFASPTSVTRDCRDSEDIVAVGGLWQLARCCRAATTIRGLRARADQRVIEMSVGELGEAVLSFRRCLAEIRRTDRKRPKVSLVIFIHSFVQTVFLRRGIHVAMGTDATPRARLESSSRVYNRETQIPPIRKKFLFRTVQNIRREK